MMTRRITMTLAAIALALILAGIAVFAATSNDTAAQIPTAAAALSI